MDSNTRIKVVLAGPHRGGKSTFRRAISNHFQEALDPTQLANVLLRGAKWIQAVLETLDSSHEEHKASLRPVRPQRAAFFSARKVLEILKSKSTEILVGWIRVRHLWPFASVFPEDVDCSGDVKTLPFLVKGMWRIIELLEIETGGDCKALDSEEQKLYGILGNLKIVDDELGLASYQLSYKTAVDSVPLEGCDLILELIEPGYDSRVYFYMDDTDLLVMCLPLNNIDCHSHSSEDDRLFKACIKQTIVWTGMCSRVTPPKILFLFTHLDSFQGKLSNNSFSLKSFPDFSSSVSEKTLIAHFVSEIKAYINPYDTFVSACNLLDMQTHDRDLEPFLVSILQDRARSVFIPTDIVRTILNYLNRTLIPTEVILSILEKRRLDNEAKGTELSV